MISRRTLIKGTVAGAGYLYLNGAYAGQTADVVIKLKAQPQVVPTFKGEKTKYMGFSAELIHGPKSTVENMPANSYLGPILRFKRGQKVEIEFDNQLNEKSIVHWHGFHIADNQDGHPRFAVDAGKTYKYSFTVDNPAGTYWYHPHPHSRTGHQVYHGLAGLIIIEDEKGTGLPQDQYDIPIVIQDREYDAKNQLIYLRGRHDRMMGMHGSKIMINGSESVPIQVDRGTYRLRILNGSNARTYNLKWSDSRKLRIVATDGGLLDTVYERDSFLFSPGERVEIVVDLDDLVTNQSISLTAAPIISGRGNSIDLVHFNGTGKLGQLWKQPNQLCNFEWISKTEAVNQNKPKSVQLTMSRKYGWSFNNQNFAMKTANAEETVKLGSTELWTFDHTRFGMIHPIHMHGAQFQILERKSARFPDLCFDKGWKDTITILPGDEVTVMKRFRDYKGLFLYHCHNLEHEDQAMMRNYKVI